MNPRPIHPTLYALMTDEVGTLEVTDIGGGRMIVAYTRVLKNHSTFAVSPLKETVRTGVVGSVHGYGGGGITLWPHQVAWLQKTADLIEYTNINLETKEAKERP